MRQETYIKAIMIFISISLIICLIINLSLSTKLNNLESQVQSISDSQYNIMSNLNSQTSSVQNILNEFKDDQSWISRIDMELNKERMEEGQADATFVWQVKELQNDSEVLFHYVYGDGNEYTSVLAEEIQQGLYQAKVPLRFELTPAWEVYVSSSSAGDEKSKKEMEEFIIQEKQQKQLKYYVTVTYDDLVKSGEVYTDYLGNFGTEYYGMLQADVNVMDDKVFIHLVNHNGSYSPIFVEEAYLMKYKGDQLIGEESLELDEQNAPIEARLFHLNEINHYEGMRLVLKVVYSNGDTFQKEVF